MSNTNFQTFHQMGDAVNSVIRQATGRRPVENIDMDYVTVAQNKVLGELEYSGSVVEFNTGRSVPIQRLVVGIEPVQSGSGDPSPENIRPISGWTGCNVTIAPTDDPDDPDKEVVTTEFPTPPGTVYGGTLDVVSGKLTIDRAIIMIQTAYGRGEYDPVTDKGNFWYVSSSQTGVVLNNLNDGVICNRLMISANVNENSSSGLVSWFANGIIRWTEQRTMSLSEYREWLANNPLQLTYRLQVPQEYQLTPQEVNTLVGDNVIYSDSGDVDVMYYVMKEFD